MNISREEPAAAPGEPGFELFEFESRQWGEVLVELLGDRDLGTSPQARWAETTAPEVTRRCLIEAREHGRLIGMATANLPLLDNTRIAYLSIVVDPSHRRRGVGSALLAELEALLAEEGRDTLESWTWERLLEPRPGLLSARDGDGVVDPANTGVAFLLAKGFKLVQVDTMSGLRLPPQRELEVTAARARDRSPEGYRLLQWKGDTPERWLDDMARLQTIMSTDIPVGEVELEPEVTDAARIRSDERVRRLGGLAELVTVAEQEGKLVGFTRIVRDPTNPQVGDQWDTLVEGDHRGNGLGMLLKTASHAALRGVWPEVSRLVTGNASENQWMLAINRALGYRPIAAAGWFERKGSVGGA